MGHAIFLVLHAAAFLFFGFWLLLITIPAHLIYAAASGRNTPDPHQPTPDTHVRCPECRELVRKDASICRHCRCRLTPQN